MQPTDRLSINGLLVGFCGLKIIFIWGLSILPFSSKRRGKSTGHQFDHWPLFPSLVDTVNAVQGSFLQPFSRDPRGSQVGFYPNVKPLNIVFYVLGRSHTNFKQNEHVKLTRKHENTQALSHTYLPDVMDIHRRLTYKCNQTHTPPKNIDITQFHSTLTQ